SAVAPKTRSLSLAETLWGDRHICRWYWKHQHDNRWRTGEQKGTQVCSQSSHQDCVGVQVSTDRGKLNIGSSGSNVHFRITGGYLGAWAKDKTPAGGSYPNQPGDLESRFEVPIIGLLHRADQGQLLCRCAGSLGLLPKPFVKLHARFSRGEQ